MNEKGRCSALGGLFAVARAAPATVRKVYERLSYLLRLFFFFFSRSYISRCGFEIIFMSRHQRLARVTTRVRYILYQVECYVRNVCVLFGHLTCPLLSIKFWNNKLPIIYVYVFDAKNCYN